MWKDIRILNNSKFTILVETGKDNKPISPYIYGSNGYNDKPELNLTAGRLGGNRLTTYNWVNNASNAGADCFNISDDYLLRSQPVDKQDIPGYLYLKFIEQQKRKNQYCLVSLQLAGYVAADKNGKVITKAPDIRWIKVKNRKGSSLCLNPCLDSGEVYMDEFINYLNYQCKHTNIGKVDGYFLDNEPSLWNATHPLIYPKPVSINRLLTDSIELAKVIKEMHSEAEIFSSSFYGFSSFLTLKDAEDWDCFKEKYEWFLSLYLAKFKEASEKYNQRLLDVIDIHWYPEAKGKFNRIIWEDNPLDKYSIKARINAPRSLYDKDYIENSWISDRFGPINLIERISDSINKHFPGTKIAISEFSFGEEDHISSGIAIADFLGAIGKNNIYMSNKWYKIENHVKAAYKLYRNYDGHNSTFGDISVHASIKNNNVISAYASKSLKNPDQLNIILINKENKKVTGEISINSPKNYKSYETYGFDQNSSGDVGKINIIKDFNGNSLVIKLNELSAVHLILKD